MDATGSRKLGDQYIDGPGVSKVRGGGFAPTVPMVVAAVVIISASQLPKCTKTRVKSHNIAYNTLKRPNIACETPKHPTGKAYDAPQFKKIFFCRKFLRSRLGICPEYKLPTVSRPSLHVQCPVP